MSRRRRIYEGKAKTLFEGPEPGTIVQYFKDDATAFNNQKKGTITGKGVSPPRPALAIIPSSPRSTLCHNSA